MGGQVQRLLAPPYLHFQLPDGARDSDSRILGQKSFLWGHSFLADTLGSLRDPMRFSLVKSIRICDSLQCWKPKLWTTSTSGLSGTDSFCERNASPAVTYHLYKLTPKANECDRTGIRTGSLNHHISLERG